MDPKKYLGVVDKKLTAEEEDQRQVAIKEYLEEYNKQNRQKSLLEEHKEKQRMKKAGDKRSHNQKMEDMMGRGFDHERDIKYSRIDPQKSFNMINKNNLDKRFTSASGYL